MSTGPVPRVRDILSRCIQQSGRCYARSTKKSWPEIVSEPAQLTYELLQISSGSSDDGNGDGGKLDARCTNNTRDPSSNRSIDKVCSIHIRTDSSDIHSSDTRTRLQLTPERQNAAREQKPIRLPSMLLREVVS